MGRYILHIDQNCFYASVEMQRHPELRDKPLAVCGRQDERHGIVLAANLLPNPMASKPVWLSGRPGSIVLIWSRCRRIWENTSASAR